MKHKKNGFTLVELIVVLVILAVLAALLVPALTGYIDKARKSQVIAETRMLTQAAQTELSSLYATNEFAEQNKYAIFTVASKSDKPYILDTSERELTGLKKKYDNIVSLSEVPSLTDGKGDFFIIADHAGKIQFTFSRTVRIMSASTVRKMDLMAHILMSQKSNLQMVVII